MIKTNRAKMSLEFIVLLIIGLIVFGFIGMTFFPQFTSLGQEAVQVTSDEAFEITQDMSPEEIRGLIQGSEEEYRGETLTVEDFTIPSDSNIQASEFIERAYNEHIRWEQGALKEDSRKGSRFVEEYWNFIGEDNIDPVSVPWSAAFISYTVRDLRGTGHWIYINAVYNQRGSDWRFFELDETHVQSGDIICGTRSRSTFNPDSNYRSHCDIVINVQGNNLIVIGGNIGDTVAMLNLENHLNNQGGYIGDRYDIGILRKIN